MLLVVSSFPFLWHVTTIDSLGIAFDLPVTYWSSCLLNLQLQWPLSFTSRRYASYNFTVLLSTVYLLSPPIFILIQARDQAYISVTLLTTRTPLARMCVRLEIKEWILIPRGTCVNLNRRGFDKRKHEILEFPRFSVTVILSWLNWVNIFHLFVYWPEYSVFLKIM